MLCNYDVLFPKRKLKNIVTFPEKIQSNSYLRYSHIHIYNYRNLSTFISSLVKLINLIVIYIYIYIYIYI